MDLDQGQWAKVASLGGSENTQERLFELGMSPGAEVRISARLPFGGPLILRVGSTQLALRRSDAKLIEVEKA